MNYARKTKNKCLTFILKHLLLCVLSVHSRNYT